MVEHYYLTLLRHAKSSWADPALDDFDRPLSKRGRRDAREMGRRLAARCVCPGCILTSPAQRARKTAGKVAKALGLRKRAIRRVSELYLAGPETMREVLAALDPGCRDVLLVAHNPGLTEFLNALADGGGVDNVPTAGAARLRLHGMDWSEALEGPAELLWFDWPKRPEGETHHRPGE